MSLTPTRRRLDLLAAVAQGRVCRYGDGNDWLDVGHKVTQAVGAMWLAGWVELTDGPAHKRPWRLTQLGAEVLAAEKGRT